MKYEDFLTDEFVDVHDLLRWNQKQLDNCRNEEYLFIFKRFHSMLEKLKESQKRLKFNKMFSETDIINNVSFIDTT
jgi:hypothetical protein